MRATKVIVLVGIVGVVMAAQNTIKQKLAQKGQMLAQVEAASSEKATADSCVE
jgi:hypothetical protein